MEIYSLMAEVSRGGFSKYPQHADLKLTIRKSKRVYEGVFANSR